jgi:hypothetical protein
VITNPLPSLPILFSLSHKGSNGLLSNSGLLSGAIFVGGFNVDVVVRQLSKILDYKSQFAPILSKCIIAPPDSKTFISTLYDEIKLLHPLNIHISNIINGS